MKKSRSKYQPGSSEAGADDAAEPAPSAAIPSDTQRVGTGIATTAHIYRRTKWQHFVRFVAFGGVMALDFGLLGSAISHHLVKTYSLASIGKEALAYFLVLLCNMAVLPSILLEANTVEVTDDRLILNNLLFRSALPWSEITSVIAPIYLKFAIIKTKKFFYLLNKRDIEGFPELINTIREKVGEAAN